MAAWLIAACISTVTGYIETGKAVNLLSLVAALLAAFGGLVRLAAACHERGGRPLSKLAYCASLTAALFFAAVAASNPVVIVQAFTYYNDGLVGSLLLALIGAGLYYVLSPERKALLAAAAAVILLVNVKFTAIAYAALICMWIVAALAVKSCRNAGAGREEPPPSHYRKVRILLKQPHIRRAIVVLGLSGLAAIVVLESLHSQYGPAWTSVLSARGQASDRYYDAECSGQLYRA